MSAADGVTAPRIQLLGPVRAWRGDQPLDLGSAHRRTVFAVLALAHGRSVSREELIDAVWGDAPPASAQGSIYTYISGLRRVLEPGRAKGTGSRLLASVGSGYTLSIGSDNIDALRFEVLREQAQRLIADGQSAAARERLDEALGLWRGTPLEGLPGPYATSHRARLEELRLTTVERRAEVALDSGNHGGLLPGLAELAAEHPLREPLQGVLIRALHRAGLRDEALGVYTRLRDRLIEASGTEPGPALRDHYEKLLAARPFAAPAVPEGSTPVRVPRFPIPVLPARPATFAGRDGEMAVLHEAVAGLESGLGRSVWIEGEPGIGKTALLAEVIEVAQHEGGKPLFAAADSLDQRFALRPLLDALGVHPRASDLRRAELAVALADDPALDPADGLLGLVRELCADEPLVLVVDDLQWADEHTLRVWRHLSRETRRLPLLLVGACRPLPRPPALETLRAELAADGTALLALGPLPDPAIAQLAGDLAGAPPGTILSVLVSHAAGNPRYAKEVVETLLSNEMILLDGAQAIVDGTACRTIPSPLGSKITLYLSFLGSGTRDVLRWAALLGKEFSLADIAIATERAATSLVGAVEEALASGVLVESGDLLAFRHPLLRRVLYEKTPAAMRVALHRQLAESFDGAGASTQRVAEQLAAAPGLVDSWVTGWLLQHIGAVAAQAPRMAVDLLKSVVAQTTLPAEAREPLTATLARLLFWLGREPEAEARSVVARTTDSRQAAEMRWILAYIYYRRGEFAEAAEEVRRTLADPRVPEMWRGRHETLRATIERLATQESAIEPDLSELGVLDGLDDAAEPLSTARRLAAVRAVPGEMHLAGAVHYYWRGRWPEALTELDTVIRGGAETASYVLRSPGSALLVHGVGALIASHRDEPGRAHEHLDAVARQSWPRDLEPNGGDYLLAARAQLAELEDGPERALTELLPLLEQNYPPSARQQWLPDLARLAMQTGDQQRAFQALRLMGDAGGFDTPPAHVAAAAHCRGIVTADPDAILGAAAHYESAGRVLKHARANEDAAILLAEYQRIDEARSAFFTALTSYTSLGAAWDVRRAETRMRPYGIRRANPVRHRAAAGE
ncbi:BTAD domain-containing putative transcriptional regulator [Amycolatopsis jiangsuensis]|uniref:DNA-binding SARP family transcriptional activator n=1 Tax=Amycolatopsis jiangsuensis TaxID=1181879 RepID=A0A840J4V1_9PSEU|nr:BTAD domain-containing putative transcriptional regulator [Amycolatopsis jiangsuensis]MBB4688438.1 DNA-binding SARP family transcriptional activator [Amycolatopsis jiangsuensis]